jgi:choline dehydrogenase-like flavoprotein
VGTVHVTLNSTTLDALLDCLVPPDEDPGAVAAGVAAYLRRLLESDLVTAADLLTAGLADLDREAAHRYRRDFALLTTEAQHAILTDAERGETATTWSVDPRTFMATVVRISAEGYYAGNQDRSSWRMVGFDPGIRPTTHPVLRSPGHLPALRTDYDVVIVGAGAGGGVAACVLAEAGANVLLVERGHWMDATDIADDHLRNHILPRYGHNTGPELDHNPRVFVTSDGAEHIVAPHDEDWHNNAMVVGGGTRVYGAQGWRYTPTDFRMASRYGIPDGSSLADWPITYDDLEPFYCEAEWRIGVAGPSQPDAHAHQGTRSRGYPMAPVALSAEGAMLKEGAARLGWRAAAVPLMLNTGPYGGRGTCVRCGMCLGFACPVDAKNGSHNTVIRQALDTGRCRLLTRTRCTGIDVDALGRVIGISVASEDLGRGSTRSIRAGHVVVSCGAIESARLLLNSRSAAHPAGLGNKYDQVGRNLQGHIYTGAFGIVDDVIQDSRGPGICLATCEFLHDNIEIGVGGGMLSNQYVKLPIGFWLNCLPPSVPAWGKANKDAMRYGYRRTSHLFGPIQEVPNSDARVTVDARVTDRLGLPVARLSGQTHPENLRTGGFLRQRAEQWLAACGASRVWGIPVEPQLSADQHQAGTCRMGTDHHTSVTDPWGRVHGHDNLWVMDGSLHVTNGGLNPALTIFALAFRNAGYLARTAC